MKLTARKRDIDASNKGGLSVWVGKASRVLNIITYIITVLQFIQENLNNVT